MASQTSIPASSGNAPAQLGLGVGNVDPASAAGSLGETISNAPVNQLPGLVEGFLDASAGGWESHTERQPSVLILDDLDINRACCGDAEDRPLQGPKPNAPREALQIL
ncbi:MAG: hypothetical protein R2762_06905 [Bryobacteraceae bacterium]